MLAGAGRGDPNQFGNYAQSAENGQTAGDLISAAVGIVETAVGIIGDAAAVALAVPSGGTTALATPVAAAAVVHGATTTTTALSNLASPSKVNASAPPQKGTRKTSNTDANQQYEEITKAQRKATKEKPSKTDPASEWEGSRKVPKQQKINSAEKSRQNMKNQNKKEINTTDCTEG